MKIQSLRIRWIDYAGYEILLPNNKVIILDPCLNLDDDINPEEFYVHGADYVLLSHTHYDHTKDLHTLIHKYDPKIITGAMSAESIARSFSINLDKLYPVYPNEEYRFEDFTLRIYHGKHKFREKTCTINDTKMFEMFPNDHIKDNLFGNMEYLDFLITTSENIRILISGGGIKDDTFCNLPYILDRNCPNILLKQTTSKTSPEEFAALIQDYHVPLIFPLHHDGLAEASKMSLDEYFGRVNKALVKMNCFAFMVNPVKHKWYSISTEIVSESEE